MFKALAMQELSAKLNIPQHQVKAAVDLLDAGNTMPFIARYRKEATGGLDEEQLRRLEAELKSMRAFQERRQSILEAIEGLGKLTDGLRQQIQAAKTRTELEDLYLPYKGKRSTRASQAREKGLEPLALSILAQERNPKPLKAFLEKLNLDENEGMAGARDIVAEQISEQAEIRARLRQRAFQWGSLVVQKRPKAEDAREVYRAYYDFKQCPSRLRPHQTLAIDRAEAEKVVTVSLEIPARDCADAIHAVVRADQRSPWAAALDEAIADGLQRLLLPAVEREVRRQLSEEAAKHAIGNFATNLGSLLLTPPLAGHCVLGLDPGFRTGCKLAVVDPTGKLLETATIYLHAADNARRQLGEMIKRYRVSLISIGNGTASRESEAMVAEILTQFPEVKYLMTNEAGASVYSASVLARAELPDLDVSLRGAVSIARRVQDPLAELVKIEPRSIGVGMYQHDLEPKELDAALTGVVESVVNRVGVEVNTASPALLTYVAGIGPKLAEKIVAHREQNGPFPDRKSISKVSGLGAKTFEQAAGFLRIRGGKNPLDASAIHPESYPVAQKVLALAGDVKEVPKLRQQDLSKLATQLGTGVPTLQDILDQLVAPGRDPRLDLPPPVLRGDVLKMEDLVVGMPLTGTVRNVVDFGAFVDIGVKQDGLLHRSQWIRGQQPQVGQVIEVTILEVQKERNRISLGLG